MRTLRTSLRYRTARLAASFVVGKDVFEPYVARLLATWGIPERRSRVDSFLFDAVLNRWLDTVYWPEPDPDVRERLKVACLAGDSGAAYARAYDLLSLDDDQTFLQLAARAVEDMGDPQAVMQVGSGSGREIAWVANRFPSATCIGTDVSSSIVEYARTAHELPNLTFELMPADRIDLLLSRLQGKLVVVSSGSLQYVQPEHLDRFFGALAQRANVELALVETVATYGHHADDLPLSEPRGNFAYSHDYRGYAARHGLATIEHELMFPYEADADPRRRATANYLWRGRT